MPRRWLALLLLLAGLLGCPAQPPGPAEFSVRLLAVGDDPEAVVAAVASGTGFDPRIARGLVERAPIPLRTGIGEADARALAAAVRAAGGTVAVLELPR